MWICGNRAKPVEEEKKIEGTSDALLCELMMIAQLITAVTRLSTVCPSTTHIDLLLSGRPRKSASRKNMKMEMEHRLAGSSSVIDNHSIAFCIEAFVFCNFSCGEEEMADEFPISLGHAVNIDNMFFGNHECMHRRLGVYILKRDD